ncbi:DUF3618 domain-containing protein [Nocardioides marmoribigeumensis]|uniref:DUF3618 domain-containing protein n=1 Tax=Nocardioides marmoribigeumensis TaxID=433649 RepID=A0ABU2BUB5_9ACTN|nr:DUF3618 domain-containing protein [Nocardioides marmoribigeumensis]MDR7362217.1 hypothetical protein [Nocardioides marmoribigeumensis]
MSTPDNLDGHQGQVAQDTGQDGAEDTPRTPEQIEADIAAQREHLAATIDALTHKLDVKSQAKAKAADVKDRATTDSGKPRPELVAGAVAAVVVVAGLWWWRHRR